MPLAFSYDINVSIQPGDIVYYTEPVNDQSGTNHPNSGATNTKPRRFGIVVDVNHDSYVVTVDTTGYSTVTLTDQYYLFFSKDRRANVSGIIGYFAETEYRNYTKQQAEMFATAVDYVQSSK